MADDRERISRENTAANVNIISDDIEARATAGEVRAAEEPVLQEYVLFSDIYVTSSLMAGTQRSHAGSMWSLEGASRGIGAICEQRNSQCSVLHADLAFAAFMSTLTKEVIRRVSSLLRRRTRRVKPNLSLAAQSPACRATPSLRCLLALLPRQSMFRSIRSRRRISIR